MEQCQSAKFHKLKQSLNEWFARHQIDNDLHFYTIEEWRSRKEEYLNDALFVIVFDGSGLFDVLNCYCSNFDALNEFEDLLMSFGFSYEMGHSWNLGLYGLDTYDYTSSERSYSQKLLDIRWQRKRQWVLERARFQCEDCGSPNNLEVHHCLYIYGYEPWEYPMDLLRCLCRTCHKKRPHHERKLRSIMASLDGEQLNDLYEYAARLQHLD